MAPAIPFIALAVGVIGAGVSVYQGIQASNAADEAEQKNVAAQKAQAEASAKAAQYQAQVARNNAETTARNSQLAEQSARYAEQAGVDAQQQQVRDMRALLGQQTVGSAANGLDVSSGSALDIRQGTETLGGASITNVRDTAARTAVGYRIQGENADTESANLILQSDMYTDAAERTLRAGMSLTAASQPSAALKATGTALSGLSSSVSQYASLSKSGAFA